MEKTVLFCSIFSSSTLAFIIVSVLSGLAQAAEGLTPAAEAEARAIGEAARTIREIRDRATSLRTRIDEVTRNLKKPGAEARGDVRGWEREVANLRSEVERLRSVRDQLRTENLERARDQAQSAAERREIDRALRTFKDLDRRIRDLPNTIAITERRLQDLQRRMGQADAPRPEPTRPPSPPPAESPGALEEPVQQSWFGDIEIQIKRQSTTRDSKGVKAEETIFLKEAHSVFLEEVRTPVETEGKASDWKRAKIKWRDCVRSFRSRETNTRRTGSYSKEEQVSRDMHIKKTGQIAETYRGDLLRKSILPSAPQRLSTSLWAPDNLMPRENLELIGRYGHVMSRPIKGKLVLYRGIHFWNHGIDPKHLQESRGVFTLDFNEHVGVKFDATERRERKRLDGSLEVMEREREERIYGVLSELGNFDWSTNPPVGPGARLWPFQVSGVLKHGPSGPRERSPILGSNNNRIEFEHRNMRVVVPGKSSKELTTNVIFVVDVNARLFLRPGNSQPACFDILDRTLEILPSR